MVAFVDESETDLAIMIEADFGPLPSDEKARDKAFYAWLHYRARCIPMRPREVIFSEKVRTQMPIHKAIGEVAARLRVGLEVAPWLSDRIRRRKQDVKADIMFNDWQVSHFHLGRIFDSPTRITRGGLLLFAFINADRAVLLDVQPHRSWSMQDLLRTLLRISPKDMATEMRGVVPDSPRTDDELFELRKKGINVPINIDGTAYLTPGIGTVANGAAIRIIRAGDYLKIMLAQIRRELETNTLPYEKMNAISSQLGVPVRLGLAFRNGAFIAYEKNRRLPFLVTRPLG